MSNTQSTNSRERGNTHAAHSDKDGGDALFQREMLTRIRRIETRLVAGMEALGATVVNHASGVDMLLIDGRYTIQITSLGTTVKDMLAVIGNETGTFDVSYNNKIKCQLVVGARTL